MSSGQDDELHSAMAQDFRQFRGVDEVQGSPVIFKGQRALSVPLAENAVSVEMQHMDGSLVLLQTCVEGGKCRRAEKFELDHASVDGFLHLVEEFVGKEAWINKTRPTWAGRNEQDAQRRRKGSRRARVFV